MPSFTRKMFSFGRPSPATASSQPSFSATDRLPVELWERIFTVACTDGGRTAYALALVSKDVHKISTDARFACVRLRGPVEVVAFEKLVNRPSGPPGRVRRLFISTYGSTAPPKQRGDSQTPFNYVAKLQERRARRNREVTRETAQTSACHILAVLAPRLIQLSVHLRNYPEDYLSLSFPMLEELEVLNGRHLTGKHAPMLPALQRLHFANIRQSDVDLIAQCTRLTHFRGSGIRGRVPDDLGRALSPAHYVAEGQTTPPHSLLCLPSSIEYVLLQPAPKDSIDIEYHAEWVASELRALASHDPRIISLRAPPRPAYVMPLWNRQVNTLEDLFLDRCEGGPGCWDLDASLQDSGHSGVDWNTFTDHWSEGREEP